MTNLHKSPPLALTLRGYIQHAPERWRAHMAAAADQVEEVARLRADLAAARARVAELERDLNRSLAIAPSNAIAWQDRAIGAELERDQYRHERDAYRDAMAKLNAPAIALATLQPPPPIIMPKSDFDWVRENDRLHQRIDRLEAIRTAASVLICAAEEWECDGLGLFAQHGYWDELHEAMERADEADANGKEPVDDIRQPVNPAK